MFKVGLTGGVYNEDSYDADLRFEGNGDANLWYLDAGNDRVGIGDATPSYKLDVNGTAYATTFLADAGAAATPSYSFAGDTDTGFYSYAANYIGIALNGVLAVCIGGDAIWYGFGSTYGASIGVANTTVGSAAQYFFSAGTPAAGAKDTGLARSAAGVVKVTNGSTGIGAILYSRSVEPVTATKSPTVTESNEVYTNEGDSDGATISLPSAATGLTYTAIVQVAQTLTVDAASGDTIRIAASVTASDGAITSNTVGNSVTLVAINATEWVATSYVGTWTF
jgi:hypothetical protein